MKELSISVISRSLRRFVAASLATVMASTLAAGTVATAQSGGNVVVVGDSYTSAPEERYNSVRNSSLSSHTIPANYPRTGGCLQDPDNWPRQMARQTGKVVKDWSCTAMTSKGMLSRLDGAIAARDLNSQTSTVFLSVGGNDFGPYGLSQGFNPADYNSQRAKFVANIAAAKAKIKRVAPNAQILIAGYPEVTNGTGICLLNFIPGTPIGVPVPGTAFETQLRNMQREGAYRNGLKFVDNYSMTRGHNTCDPNGKTRYVNAWFDTTSTPATMPLHPTYVGHRALAMNNARAAGL